MRIQLAVILTALLGTGACTGFGDIFDESTSSGTVFDTTNVPGKYRLDIEFVISGQTTKTTDNVSLIDSSLKVIFGTFKNGTFSEAGLNAAINSSGTKYTLPCTNNVNGTDFNCTGTNIPVGTNGGVAETLTCFFVRTGDSVAIGNFTVPVVSPPFTANGLDTETGWSTGAEILVQDAIGDAISGSPGGADIDYIKLGKDASPPTMIYVFIKLTSNMTTNVDYRFSLSNDTYSEILFDTYDATGFQTQYRLNDDSHQTIAGLAADPGLGTGNSIEFGVPVGSLNNPVVVDNTKLTQLTLELKNKDGSVNDGDTYDASTPILYIDF